MEKHFKRYFFIYKCICDVLRDLVRFVQFKTREKNLWGSVTFSKVVACNFTKTNVQIECKIAQRNIFMNVFDKISNMHILCCSFQTYLVRK